MDKYYVPAGLICASLMISAAILLAPSKRNKARQASTDPPEPTEVETTVDPRAALPPLMRSTLEATRSSGEDPFWKIRWSHRKSGLEQQIHLVELRTALDELAKSLPPEEEPLTPPETASPEDGRKTHSLDLDLSVFWSDSTDGKSYWVTLDYKTPRNPRRSDLALLETILEHLEEKMAEAR